MLAVVAAVQPACELYPYVAIIPLCTGGRTVINFGTARNAPLRLLLLTDQSPKEITPPYADVMDIQEVELTDWRALAGVPVQSKAIVPPGPVPQVFVMNVLVPVAALLMAVSMTQKPNAQEHTPNCLYWYPTGSPVQGEDVYTDSCMKPLVVIDPTTGRNEGVEVGVGEFVHT